MKTKALGWMAALTMVGSAFAFASCTQPKTECQVGLSSTGYSYVAKYTLKNQPPAACLGLVKPGETFGMEFYHPASADKTTFDGSKTTFAVGSDDFGSAIDTYGSVGGADPCAPGSACTKDSECGDPALACVTGYCTDKACSALHTPWGLGDFTSPSADEHDLCSVSKTSASQQVLPEIVDEVGLEVAGTPCTTDVDCQSDTGLECATTDDCDIVLGAGVATCGTTTKTCLDAASGAICDTTAGECVVGCHAKEGTADSPNGCVYPFTCTSTDETLGQCKLPALSAKYEWKDLQFYVTASAPGTQFSGELTYTEGDCTLEYTAVGLWPAIYCEGTDENGNPTGLPDDRLCSPCTDADAGISIGSGINPDFPTRCDPDLLYCVLVDAKDKDKDATSVPQLLSKSIDCGPIN